MTNRVCVLLLLLVTSPVFACLNEIGSSTVSEGIYVEKLSPEEFLTAMLSHPGKTYWLGVLGELKVEDIRSRAYDKFTNRNNTAVAMLHVGMVGQAIKILEGLERTDPGSYYTAANLGTAYELNGENEKALKWIKEGITRDPDAHNGSEWLHVKILEAKIALERDPNWLTSNSVIGLHKLSEEQLIRPVATGNKGQAIDLKEVEAAIVYQLHERLEFIKPPEKVVASLLYDLSRIHAQRRETEHAAVIRAFAETYGPDLLPWQVPDPALPAVELPPAPSMTPYWLAGALALLVVLIAGTLILWIRRRGHRSAHSRGNGTTTT